MLPRSLDPSGRQSLFQSFHLLLGPRCARHGRGFIDALVVLAIAAALVVGRDLLSLARLLLVAETHRAASRALDNVRHDLETSNRVSLTPTRTWR